MRFEWDAAKDRANRNKHGVSFELARQVFEDPFHLSVQDRIEGSEERWQTIGLVGGAAVLLVAHTWREDDGVEVVRIISARKATKQERRRYEENNV
ncbi:MAG: BrnT family toxin [Rhodospirillales bacterium]|jgi:hypothetical protein